MNARPTPAARTRMRIGAFLRHARGLLWALAFVSVAAAATPIDPLILDTTVGEHDAWDHARMQIETEGEWTAAQAQAGRFTPMGSMRSNLGKRREGVWISVPVLAKGAGASRWVLDIDYASLDRIEVYLAGEPGAAAPRLLGRMGDQLAYAERPMRSRSHAMTLDLPADQPRTLLIRVQTTGSMVVPLLFYTHERLHEREAHEQSLQGLLAGAGLCLLIYSLAQWAMLRDAMFGLYALTLLGSVGFFAALSGVGPQHVWGASDWLTRNGPPFFILLGVCGAFFFVLRALEVARISPRTAWVVRVCGGLAGLTALAFLLGAVTYGVAQAVGMVLGPTPLLLVLPTAFKRLRAGDMAARFVLMGWGAYAMGVLVLVGLLQGWVPVGFWTLHAFQFASLVEMSMWMMVLGHRVHDIRVGAERMKRDRDLMRSLALTDALTGLLNRRGLQEAAQPMLANSSPRRLVALYLMDLDGFKPVNDTLGHDAGDELLAGVGQRLREQVRATDLVCRLGGDEFVVMAGGLSGPEDAQAVGDKLLQSVREPFVVAGRPTRVGLTVGYALAPQDESTLEGLMRRADAAMYAGKQAGKNRVQRGAAHSAFAQVGSTA
jgi:diguanylate cyclase